MKKLIIALSLASFLLGIAWAHPASKVDLSYNKATKILTVQVGHAVKDNVKHYIKSLQITVNKRDVLTHNLTLQDNLKGGTYSYKLNDVKTGDTISVKTECNFVGAREATIKIK